MEEKRKMKNDIAKEKTERKGREEKERRGPSLWSRSHYSACGEVESGDRRAGSHGYWAFLHSVSKVL